jgi:coenzyme F420-0:L-glutamate ligase / coenzyme F420-1:gamma-L-glutamate ligase
LSAFKGMDAPTVTLTAIPGIPLIEPGDDLAAILAAALREAGLALQDKDVLVVAQKIVSKAGGRYVELDAVRPSPRARELAAEIGKDPRHVEVVLAQSAEVVRHREGLLITEHRLGFVMANAGVDQSNIEHGQGRERVLLLPEDPDGACAALKAELDEAFEVDVGIVINDSFGRPWRNGVAGVAIGAAGIPSLKNLIGAPDLFGRPLRVTEIAFADEVAAAASMLMGQGAEGLPVVHVRGLRWSEPPVPAKDLIRPKHRDLFR